MRFTATWTSTQTIPRDGIRKRRTEYTITAFTFDADDKLDAKRSALAKIFTLYGDKRKRENELALSTLSIECVS